MEQSKYSELIFFNYPKHEQVNTEIWLGLEFKKLEHSLRVEISDLIISLTEKYAKILDKKSPVAKIHKFPNHIYHTYWKVYEVGKRGKSGFSVVLANEKKWQLTNWLEFGTAKARAYPHIFEVFEKLEKQIRRRVEETIKRSIERNLYK